MNRIVLPTLPVDDRRIRHRVRIESDDCEQGTPHARMIQFMILENMGHNPDLSNCGPGPFQTMTMRHSGAKWIIELESVYNKE